MTLWGELLAFSERNKELWPMMQGIFTPLAIVVSVWFALAQQRDKALSDLIAMRNIAQTSQRLIFRELEFDTLDRFNEISKNESETLHKAWESVKFGELDPPFLMKDFLDIYHMHLRIHNYLFHGRDFDRGDTKARAGAALGRIDIYVKSMPVYQKDDDYYVSSWIERRWHDISISYIVAAVVAAGVLWLLTRLSWR